MVNLNCFNYHNFGATHLKTNSYSIFYHTIGAMHLKSRVAAIVW